MITVHDQLGRILNETLEFEDMLRPVAFNEKSRDIV